MIISRPFILRPVATALLMVAIVMSGLVALRFLPLSALPQVDFPTIQVRAAYPGASPDVISQTLTAPLERQFGQVAGLKRMSSSSAAGISSITLQFSLGIELDVAEQEVQAAINAASTLLPADLPAPPTYAKINPADAPVLTLALTSDTLPLTEVQDIANTRLALKISQVPGVGLVSLSGGQKPAIRIQANPRALAAAGLGLDSLRTAIASANANTAKGNFDGPTRFWAINANDQLSSIDQYKQLVVAYKNGAPVRLADVANVVQAAENVRLGAWANLKPAVILNVQRQPGANVIETVDAIKQRLPELQAAMPAAIAVDVLSDRTAGIRSSVNHVATELLLAVALVVLAILAFLHNGRATVIASMAVPISLIGTLGVMYLMDYSLNNLSLMALTIATGFVVDDAIVMTENISRHLEKGMPPLQAALKGAGEIGFTIVSLTLSLIAVLIPLLFMSDIVGRLFREFAATLAITILISALVSLTLVPMMSGRWLRADKDLPRSRVGDWLQSRFDALRDAYAHTLDLVLARQGLTLVVAALTLALTVVLYLAIPKGLFPVQDTGQLQVRVEAANGISYARMSELQQQVAREFLQDPDVSSLSSHVGVGVNENAMLHTGSMLVNLKQDRPRIGHDQQQIMDRLRERASRVPGITVYLQPTQDLTIDAEAGPTPFRVAIEGADTAVVNRWARLLAQQMENEPALQSIVTDAGASGPSVTVKLDRDSASRLAVTAAAIDDALYSAFGQRIVSTIFTETNQYRVILEALPGTAASPASLADLPLRTASGKPTTLGSIATVQEQQSPLQITHVDQFPAATLGFDAAPGQALGDAVAAVRRAASELLLPGSVSLNFLGAAGAFEAALSNQLWLILAAIVCVYIVLGVLYESYIHPLTILSTLPSAGVGALLAMMLAGQPLGVIGIIGIILLIGIVKKNAIMMIDFAISAERDEGKTPHEAIRQAALLRLRPILMTTFAALFAALPLMLSQGDGAELRRPLGTAIFGGLLLSQLLTLYTTPVIYLGFDRLGRRWFGASTRHGSNDTDRNAGSSHGAPQ
jgi:multidrug efflux pump